MRLQEVIEKIMGKERKWEIIEKTMGRIKEQEVIENTIRITAVSDKLVGLKSLH